MKIFGQTPAEIADVLLSMAKPGESITVGGSGYSETEARAVVEEIWQRQSDYGLKIKDFRSVIGVLEPETTYHGKPVDHLPDIFDPTVEVRLEPR
ncbi:MAG TPA: hypothetical protein VM659_01090 [Dongiaceae bacterium]|nr:hypothetical protein [Dongiaceae bacterium]